MRQGQQNNNNNNNNNNRRNRGRGRNRTSNPLTKTYESNGPDVKIKGTAADIAQKYMALARDQLSSGNTVTAEAYLQHAEHYNRIIMAAQAKQDEVAPQHARAQSAVSRFDADDIGDDDEDEGEDDQAIPGYGEQPVVHIEIATPAVPLANEEERPRRPRQRPPRRQHQTTEDNGAGNGNVANGELLTAAKPRVTATPDESE